MGALTKFGENVLLSAGIPGRPPVPPNAMRLYAPPSQKGYMYTALRSAADFADWSPLYAPPVTDYVRVERTTWTFVADQGSGSWAIPAGSQPVYGNYPDPTAPGGYSYGLVGWLVPYVYYTYQYVYTPPQWYWPTANMEFFQFDEVVDASNGFPRGNIGDVVTGRVTVPTTTGAVVVERKFQIAAGRLEPLPGGSADPPYCKTKAGYGILMLSNFPGREEVPAVPPEYAFNPHAGWNAGANSIRTLDGDVHVSFSLDVAAGIVLGFCTDRASPADFAAITHGVVGDFSPEDGARRFQIMERGKLIGVSGSMSGQTRFDIKRFAGGGVQYMVDDALVYTSTEPLFGPLFVASALYLAGDEVP